jgi:hypothetical protein
MSKFIRLLSTAALLITAFGLSVFSVHAQESVEYGDIVEGEMTNDEFEFEYSFEGEEGDVVVIILTPVELYDELINPIMILENPEGDTIGDTTDAFVFGGPLILAAELDQSGKQTLFVTRQDKEDGESVGEFTIEFILLEVLEVDEALEGELKSESRAQYYAVKTDNDFAINWIRGDGDMLVRVSVNEIDNSNGLTEIGGADGSQLTEVAFGIFEGGETYIVSIAEPLFSFSFEETVEYQIVLLEP